MKCHGFALWHEHCDEGIDYLTVPQRHPCAKVVLQGSKKESSHV